MKSQQPSYGELKNKMRDEALAEQTGKFYEMAQKSSESPWGPVSAAPSQTVTGAQQALGESGKTFSGSGGYEYGQLADGSFMILKSGKGFNPGTVVKPGMKGYDAIKNEFEMVKAGKPIPEKPRSASAPKPAATKPAAPKAAAPKAAAPVAPPVAATTKAPSVSAGKFSESPRRESAPKTAGGTDYSSDTKRNELWRSTIEAFRGVGVPEGRATDLASQMLDSREFSTMEGIVRSSKAAAASTAKPYSSTTPGWKGHPWDD